MAAMSKIEWTDCTWNPVTGCSHVSEGCENCYAERMAKRLQAMGNPNYVDGFKVRCHRHMLARPLEWRTPRYVFVNSMSDLFHPEVPTEFIKDVFAVMAKAHWHTFQVLTKRAERLWELGQSLPWSPNIWAGVTIENQACLSRLDSLLHTQAPVRFLSLEPLLDPLSGLDLSGIDWVIVGGESGPKARPMRPEWVRSIRDMCEEAQVPFFFKQWGGTNRKATGRVLDGRTWDERPVSVLA
jgi:protein gp37